MTIRFDSEGAGCGAVILSFALGCIYGAAWGWAVFGAALIVTSVRVTTRKGAK